MKKIRLLAVAVFVVMGLFYAMNALATTYSYDQLDRLAKVVYDDGSSSDYRYDAAGNITSIISIGTATVSLGSLTQTYDGSAKSATATTNPPGKNVTFTYNGSANAPTNIGSYAVVGTVSDAIYSGTASGTLTISGTTPAIVSATGTTFTYGSAATFNVLATGNPAATLSYSGVLPTGVAFHANGDGSATISGTANATGSFPITIIATNSAGSVSQSFTLVVAVASSTTLSALDSSITISPDRHLFGVVQLGSCGDSIPFTVRNSGGSDVVLGSVSIGGTDYADFSIAANGCTGQTLSSGAACTAGVQFCPTSIGSKSALLEMPHGGVTTTAFLYNYESIQEEAARRVPPVLTNLNIPVTMQAGQSYTITWSLTGYDIDYLSRVAFFNCNGISNGTCGAGFGSNFQDSGNIAAVSSTTGDWSYSGVTSQQFNYSYTFTAPASATDIVIRFYRKTTSDDAAGKGSLSLLIPGNAVQSGTSYYDSDGRRLLHAIVP